MNTCLVLSQGEEFSIYFRLFRADGKDAVADMRRNLSAFGNSAEKEAMVLSWLREVMSDLSKPAGESGFRYRLSAIVMRANP